MTSSRVIDVRARIGVWVTSGLVAATLLGCAGCPQVASDDATEQGGTRPAPTDTAPTDTAPIDTAPTDTAPIDTAPIDTASTVPALGEGDGAFIDYGEDHPDDPRRRGEPQFLPAIDIRVGGRAVRVEIARNDPERQRGLMHRTELGPDAGMLFCFPYTKFLSFWMQNTILPLSIAYIDESGVILQIEQLKPFDETSVASDEQGRFALEMNQGWFAAHGIGPGARLEGLGVIFTTPSLKPE